MKALQICKGIFDFYKEGFGQMKLGKTLWKIIFIKLFIIFFVLEFFIFDENFKAKFKDETQRSDFVLQNLLQKSELKK